MQRKRAHVPCQNVLGATKILTKWLAYKNILSLNFHNIRKLRDGAPDGLNLWDLFIDGGAANINRFRHMPPSLRRAV